MGWGSALGSLCTPSFFMDISSKYFKIQSPKLKRSWSAGDCRDVEKEVQRRIGDERIKVRWHLTHMQYEIWWMSTTDAYVIAVIDPKTEFSSAKICHIIEQKQITSRQALQQYLEITDLKDRSDKFKRDDLRHETRGHFDTFSKRRVITS